MLWLEGESNSRPFAYETSALPLSYPAYMFVIPAKAGYSSAERKIYIIASFRLRCWYCMDPRLREDNGNTISNSDNPYIII